MFDALFHLFIWFDFGFNAAFNTLYGLCHDDMVLRAEETSRYQLVKILHCKLPDIGKKLPTFPHKVQSLNCRPHTDGQRVCCPHHTTESHLMYFKFLVFVKQSSLCGLSDSWLTSRVSLSDPWLGTWISAPELCQLTSMMYHRWDPLSSMKYCMLWWVVFLSLPGLPDRMF